MSFYRISVEGEGLSNKNEKVYYVELQCVIGSKLEMKLEIK